MDNRAPTEGAAIIESLADIEERAPAYYLDFNDRTDRYIVLTLPGGQPVGEVWHTDRWRCKWRARRYSDGAESGIFDFRPDACRWALQ